MGGDIHKWVPVGDVTQMYSTHAFMGMQQFSVAWFGKHRKIKPQYDFSSFLLCCNPGDLPKHHLELGGESGTDGSARKVSSTLKIGLA